MESQPNVEVTPETIRGAPLTTEELQTHARETLATLEREGLIQTYDPMLISMLQAMSNDLANKTIQIDPESNQLAITNNTTGETEYTTRTIREMIAPVNPDGEDSASAQAPSEVGTRTLTFNPDNAITIIENGQPSDAGMEQLNIALIRSSNEPAGPAPDQIQQTEEQQRRDAQTLINQDQNQGFLERLQNMDFSSNPQMGMMIQALVALINGDMDGVMDAIENGMRTMAPQQTPEQTAEQTAEQTPEQTPTQAENDVGGVDGSPVTYVVERPADIPVANNPVILAAVTGQDGAPTNILTANFANNTDAQGTMVNARVEAPPTIDNALATADPDVSMVMRV